jgi:hypothetical protein
VSSDTTIYTDILAMLKLPVNLSDLIYHICIVDDRFDEIDSRRILQTDIWGVLARGIQVDTRHKPSNRLNLIWYPFNMGVVLPW